MLKSDNAEIASVVHSAVEEFGQQLASVTRRFLGTKGWSDVNKIVFGGGFRNSRIGELALH